MLTLSLYYLNINCDADVTEKNDGIIKDWAD